MSRNRTTFSAEFKMQVVLETFNTDLTFIKLASKYNTSVKNITNWKEQFLKNAHLAFEKPLSNDHVESLKKENKKLEKMIKKEQKEEEFILRTLHNPHSKN